MTGLDVAPRHVRNHDAAGHRTGENIHVQVGLGDVSLVPGQPLEVPMEFRRIRARHYVAFADPRLVPDLAMRLLDLQRRADYVDESWWIPGYGAGRGRGDREK